MTRLPRLDEGALPPSDRHLLARPIDVHRVLANIPEILRGVVEMGDWIRYDSDMDPRLRELGIIHMGVCANSVYEYAHHVKIGLDYGVTPDDLDNLLKYAEGRPTDFGANELAVLDATTQLAEDGTLSDCAWDGLSQCLGPNPAAQLVATVSYYAMIVRLLASFAVELEPEYHPYLAQYPLPSRKTA